MPTDSPALGSDQILDAPLALVSDGNMLANVTHLFRGDDPVELLRRALTSGRAVYIGVALTEEEIADAIVRIDDAAAEIVAMAVKLA